MKKQNKNSVMKMINKILIDLGLAKKPKKRNRSKMTYLSLFKMEDGTLYKQKKNMIASQKVFVEKVKLDSQFILDENQNNNEGLPKIEDMTSEQIIKYCNAQKL
jgi:hypothetical protein